MQVAALKEGKITKPVVAWVSGTCAKLFKSEVQFGHAGAKSGGLAESAQVISATRVTPRRALHTLKPGGVQTSEELAGEVPDNIRQPVVHDILLCRPRMMP